MGGPEAGGIVLAEFGFLGIFLALAVVVPTSMLIIPWVATKLGVKPQHPDPVKLDTYECGMPTIGGNWVRFNFRYYQFAILFVAFDVTAAFAIPWAVHLRVLGWAGLWSMLAFAFILGVGLAYAWRKKALQW